MKKVFSIFAAAMVCALMLVSCAKSAFQNELDAINSALDSKDFATVIDNANKIINGTEQAAAADLVCAGTALNSVVVSKQEAGEIEAQEAIDLLNKVSAAFEAAKSKSDYNAALATSKAAGVDVEALATAIPATVASFQATIDAATQQAEATEGEATEGEATEGAAEGEATEAVEAE